MPAVVVAGGLMTGFNFSSFHLRGLVRISFWAPRRGDLPAALRPVTHLLTIFNDTQNPVKMVRHDRKFPQHNIPSHFGGFYPFVMDTILAIGSA